MKNIIIILLIIAFPILTYGQQVKVNGALSTTDSADLSVINIFPDAFPNVSIVFKAETNKKEPVWNLTKESMRVKEDFINCEIISLEQISKSKAINIGIVIDHSASMREDDSQFYDKNGNFIISFDTNWNPIFPKSYIAPIDNAKSAVKNFVSTFDTKKDLLSIIGFATTVDILLPLTSDTSQINSAVESMKPDSSTALYDAMIRGITEIKKSDGLKVLVVLTDGYDNSSNAKWEDVVGVANLEEIPIYIIGLGNVNKDTLKLIAKSTNGDFYSTSSSKSLDTIYREISKRLQAFYELIYSSPNFSSADSTRQIELSFTIDSIYLVAAPSTINLPAEIIQFMARKEREKQYFFYGSIALAILIGAGTLLFYFRRRKQNYKQPTIQSLYPNPTNGVINLAYVSSSGQLQIINLKGQVVRTFEIGNGELSFDLSDLNDDNYIAVIQAERQLSNAIKFAIRR